MSNFQHTQDSLLYTKLRLTPPVFVVVTSKLVTWYREAAIVCGVQLARDQGDMMRVPASSPLSAPNLPTNLNGEIFPELEAIIKPKYKYSG